MFSKSGKKCKCGTTFATKSSYNRHIKTCVSVATASAETVRLAAQSLEQGPSKRPRVLAPEWMRPLSSQRKECVQEENPSAGPSHEESADFGIEALGYEMEPSPIVGGSDPSDPSIGEPPKITRSGRAVRPSWKVRNTLPEDVGDVLEEEGRDLGTTSQEEVPQRRPMLRLLLTDYVRTVANKFGLRRFYKRRPHRPPKARADLEACYAPTANVYAKRKVRTVAEIIFPFPNISSWRLSWHYTRGHKKTLNDAEAMEELLARPDFVASDITPGEARKLREQVAAGVTEETPWANENEGWRKSSVTIGIPLGKKSTQASRREAYAAARRVNRHEPAPDTPAIHSIAGEHFTVLDFHHKNMTAEIKKTFSTDPASADFVLDPYLVEHGLPQTDKSEHVHGELFNSPAFVQEDIRLQNSPREPGCDLPRVIAAIMLWSDATVVSQFGSRKVWPAYMYFGNQSKYTRARPTAHAAHHIAYFVSLPDNVQDFIRKNSGGKAASAALLTHCRRELFHAQWGCLLDDEFVEAYEHGVVVDCFDGVRRRVYPRIFTYSADYPEKMLIATLRDKGRCPCPRCLVTFDAIPGLGTPADSAARMSSSRSDNAEKEATIQKARELIYNDGYVVNSEHVEALLREQSLVPTENAFTSRLGKFGFQLKDVLVVDQLHEFELGVWKAIFKHLVRILDAAPGSGLIQTLNERFRDVPAYAWTTIRKFAENICEMKQMAARDFEDILQCIIPCFEGLLPEAEGDQIATLLFLAAYWHALAKMRMHTDTSLALLDDTTVALGNELRQFAVVTCAAFQTRETQAEYEARKRAEERRTRLTTAQPGAQQASTTTSSAAGRRPRQFNLQTVKLHFLGDYGTCIRSVGTTDSTTTHIGEHEHRVVKSRHDRTNNVGPGGQLVKIDTFESRMRFMAEELTEIGVDVPGVVSHSKDVEEPITIRPEEHHKIGATEKNYVLLSEWQLHNPDDPAVQMFTPLLKAHLRLRLTALIPALAAEDVPIILRHDRVYLHATAHLNYTTYDLQRDQDIIHPSANKADILVHTPNGDDPYPWTYARVLGIYHANVVSPDGLKVERVEFLYVRWFQRDTSWEYGTHVRRLERVQFVPHDGGAHDGVFGFVDPSHVIRTCHLIPAFHHGRVRDYLAPSYVREEAGDWKYFYVNRFVDRDMFVRFLGCGVGLLELQARTTEQMPRGEIDESSLDGLGRMGNGVSGDADEESDSDDEDERHRDLEDIYPDDTDPTTRDDPLAEL